MFDLGAAELLLIAIVAVIVIGPKDLPLAMRTVGRFVGKVRRVSSQFRAGFDAMVREAELEEMEKKWKDRNAAIMAEHPDPDDMQAPYAASAEGAESTPTAESGDQRAAGADAPPPPP